MIAKKLLRPGCAWIALLLLISCGLMSLDISRMNNAAHEEVSRITRLELTLFVDSDSPLDEISDTQLIVYPGEDIRFFEGNVPLADGENWSFSMSVRNLSNQDSSIYVDLYVPEGETVLCSFNSLVSPGENQVRGNLYYQGMDYPDTCVLRVVIQDSAELRIQDMDLYSLTLSHRPRRLAAAISMGLLAVSILCVFFLICYLVKKRAAIASRKTRSDDSSSREWMPYAAAFLIVTAALCWIYRAADITLPLYITDGDEMGIFFLVKAIREKGTTLMSSFEGGLAGADMFDYPYSDKLSFVIVRLITLFTANTYLTVNLFYFLCHHLCALSAIHACRKLGFSRPSSLLVGILFAFSAFISQRYSHMWLIPYFMLPQACRIGVEIIQGKYDRSGIGTFDRPDFWRATGVAYLCAFTGLYYAFFACAIFAAAIVIRVFSDREHKLSSHLLPLLLISAVMAGVLTNVIPNLLYTYLNGPNPSSELAARQPADTEVYGLKMAQLLLPRLGHRLGRFANTTSYYTTSFPLVTENVTSSLGMLASAGFLLSIIFLLAGKPQCHPFAALNVSVFLIGTIGGLGTMLSLVVSNPMRCYNRISLVILFLSLCMIAWLLDHLQSRLRGPLYPALCLVLMLGGLYDQTIPYWPPDTTHFQSIRSTVDQIEHTLQPADSVFVLPYDDWPSPKIVGSYRSHLLYVESDDIIWSYGAMQGRSEALWQQKVSGLDTPEMISVLSRHGYDGIFLDQPLYARKHGEEAAAESIARLTECLGEPDIVSEDETLYFWTIPE